MNKPRKSRLLRKPLKLLSRVLRRKPPVTLELSAFVANYNHSFFEMLGVDESDVRRIYAETSKKVGLDSDDNQSVHRLAFTALKKKGIEPKSILELGTRHGETTVFLATLFPDAQVFTVDLPASDPLFQSWFSDAKERDALVQRRFAPFENIHAILANTFDLPAMPLPSFDLIWLDAGHDFPEVAWDHAYCFGRLSDGGWLLSDDIRLPNQPGGKAREQAPYQVVEYIKARKNWPNGLLLKRENPERFLRAPKYVAWFHKTKRKSH